jgi:hypothetical protein
MIITGFLERNAKLYGDETALIETNPRRKTRQPELDGVCPCRIRARGATVGKSPGPTLTGANQFANLLLANGVKRRKVAILLMTASNGSRFILGTLKAAPLPSANYRYTAG